MTKSKSNQLSKLSYILLIPACMLLISAFTTPSIQDNEYVKLLNVAELRTPPSLFPVQNATKESISSHYGMRKKHILIKTK